MTEVSRDYTINLHKRLYKTTFKNKAPKAVKQIVEFAKKNMHTEVLKFKDRTSELILN
jgi:large subunit ribosomal protein L31e